MDIKELVSQEAAWLANQEARTVNKMMRVYQDSFLELEGKLKALEGKNTYSARHMRLVHAQLGAVMETMREKHGDLLGAQVRRVFNQQIPRDKKAWQKLEQAFGDPKTASQYADFKPIIPQQTIKALVNTQNIAISGFNQLQQKQIRSIIAQSVSQGEGVKQTMRRLGQFKGQAKNKNHLHLIVRMETARASNQGKVELIKQMQLEFPKKEFWLMVKDLVDKTNKTRNHWLSWALSGTVRNVTKKEYYEVHTAALNAAKAEYKTITGRKASNSGILMKHFELGLRTKSIPAHFGDRGVEVGWSPDWSGKAFGEAKHPQGEPKMPSENSSRSGRDVQDESQTPPLQAQPTGHLRQLSGPEVRAQIKDKGLETLALQKAFEKEEKARDKQLFRIEEKNRQKKKILTLEKQRYNRLHDENRIAGERHLATLYAKGEKFRNAILLPDAPRLNIQYGPGVLEPLREKTEITAKGFGQMLGGRLPLKPIKIIRKTGRPQFQAGQRDGEENENNPDLFYLNEKNPTYLIVHELTHFFELWDKKALQESLKFLDNRVRGEDFVQLSKIYPREIFGKDEWTRKDHFNDAYSGKSYYVTRKGEVERSLPKFPGEPPIGSEILATGFEQMYLNPALFSVRDPKFFDFIWEIMRGKDSVSG